MPSSTTLPRPNARDAPKFDGESPDNLRRFIKQMEDLYTECSVSTDDEKKNLLGKYADARTEEEWQAFDSYTSGSWNEYKAEILENYPSAALAEEGSLVHLEKIQKANRDIYPEDVEGFMSLKRKFTAEAQKLVKDPPLISNRELVERFLGCLSKDFQEQVVNGLNLKRSLKPKTVPAAVIAAGGAAAQTPVTRRKEDQHDWKAVITEAQEISTNIRSSLAIRSSDRNTGRNSDMSTRLDSSVKLELEEVKQQMNQVMDRITINEKRQQQGIDTILKTLQQSSESAPTLHSRNYRQPNSLPPVPGYQVVRDNDGNCFYCLEPDHRANDCPHRHAHLEQGKIKIVDGRIRLADGSWIPREPADKSQKDRVEAASANRRAGQLYMGDYSRGGIIPLGGPSDLSSPMSIYTNQLYDSRDDMIAQLRNQLSLEKAAKAQIPAQQFQMTRAPVVPTMQPMQFDPSTLMQLSTWMNQINQLNQMNAMNPVNAPAARITSEEDTSQFVNTRSNPQPEEQPRPNF